MNSTKMPINEHVIIEEYYRALWNHYEQQGLSKLISMIRKVDSEETAIIIYKKYHKLHYCGMFAVYNLKEKIKSFNELIDALKYFEVEYHEPPKEIAHIFVQEKTESSS